LVFAGLRLPPVLLYLDRAMPGKRGGALPAPVWVRFWAKVDKAGLPPAYRPDLGPCWLWTGAVNNWGYGVIWDGKRLRYAHHLSYDLHGLTVPEGMELDHLCSVRTCVRPTHLEPTTHLENVRRAWRRKREAA
jgi:hypothetical protein